MFRRILTFLSLMSVVLTAVPASPTAAAGAGSIRIQIVDCSNITDDTYMLDDCEAVSASPGIVVTGPQELALDSAWRDNRGAYVFEGIQAGTYIYPNGYDDGHVCGDAVSQDGTAAFTVEDNSMRQAALVRNMPTNNPPMDCAKALPAAPSAAIQITARACPQGVNPKTNPEGCTIAIDLQDSVMLSPWRAGGDGAPVYRVDRYPTDARGVYRIGYADTTYQSYALTGLDRSDYSMWYVDGLAEQKPTTSWTVDIAPWQTTEITVFYHDPVASRQRRQANPTPGTRVVQQPTAVPPQNVQTGGLQIMLSECRADVPKESRLIDCGWRNDNGSGWIQLADGTGPVWNLSDLGYMRGYHWLQDVPAGQYVIGGLDQYPGYSVEVEGADALLDGGAILVTIYPNEYTYVTVFYTAPANEEVHARDNVTDDPTAHISIVLWSCSDATLSDCKPIDDDGSMWMQNEQNPAQGSRLSDYHADLGVYSVQIDPGNYLIGGFQSTTGKNVLIEGSYEYVDNGTIRVIVGPGSAPVITIYYYP